MVAVVPRAAVTSALASPSETLASETYPSSDRSVLSVCSSDAMLRSLGRKRVKKLLVRLEIFIYLCNAFFSRSLSQPVRLLRSRHGFDASDDGSACWNGGVERDDGFIFESQQTQVTGDTVAAKQPHLSISTARTARHRTARELRKTSTLTRRLGLERGLSLPSCRLEFLERATIVGELRLDFFVFWLK